MKKLITVLMLVIIAILAAACGGQTPSSAAQTAPAKTAATAAAEGLQGKKTLIAYFSYSGTTERAAQDAQKLVGGDLFKIATVNPYPSAYRECTEVAKAEMQNDARPALQGQLPNTQDYDVIFIGYPIWWHQAPMAVFSFIEQSNLNGKTVVLFCTSGGSDISETLPKLHDALGKQNAKVIDGITVNRPEGIDEWLVRLGYKK